MTASEQLATARYVLLTTYRRDGSPVATPVWVAPLEGALGVWSAPDAGKVKRIRRDPAVQVAVCDFRGGNAGPAHSGQAELLDPGQVPVLLQQLRRKYGLVGRLTLLGSRLRGRLASSAGIRIVLD
jgi:hypothetical protein